MILLLHCYGNTDVNKNNIFWKVCSMHSNCVKLLVLLRPDSEVSAIQMFFFLDYSHVIFFIFFWFISRHIHVTLLT